MLAKIIIISVLLGIFLSLGSSLYFLLSDDGKSNRTVKALTIRIALSIFLFTFLMLAFKLHWINPHGI